jgi:DNA-binding transcriptional regulator YhcF (GntR family)
VGDDLVVFKQDVPIYLQIATDIKEQIMSNKYSEGSKLPSVREFAVIYEVTTLTVQRAIQHLESQDIVKSKKGIGSFVVDNCRKKLEKNMIYKQAKDFVRCMRNMGMKDDEIESLISEALKNERCD